MFTENPWWRPDFYHRTNEELLLDILKTKDKIFKFINNKEYINYLEDYTQHHKLKYLQECVVAESNIKLSLQQLENILKEQSNDKLYKKITNIQKCINKIFGNELYINQEIKYKIFNIDSCKKIHKIIGKEIIDNCGEFRIKMSAPKGSEMSYLAPHLIQKHLSKLFDKTQESLKNINEIEDYIKTASNFCMTFLYIHPFSNGNGRVCRMYTSMILQPITITPMSMFLDKNGRNIYLKCLEKSQLIYTYNSDEKELYDLNTFLLECIQRNNINMYNTLGMDEN